MARVDDMWYHTPVMSTTSSKTRTDKRKANPKQGARRTMRQMDKSYRPEIAGELEQTPENLAYGQLTRANKQMRAVSREIVQVAWAKSLPDVQRLVQERARTTRRPKLMGELRGKGVWDDIGALKAWLRDDLVGERNRYAREVAKDVKARRRESEATP